MHISIHNHNYTYPTKPAFCARTAKTQPKVSSANLYPNQSSIVKSSESIETLPTRLELSEFEKIFNESLLKLHTLETDIRTQKQNLHWYYSAQDKMDYQELLSDRRKLTAKLSKMAKKNGTTFEDVATEIEHKKTFNRLAPKIRKCKTREELLLWQAEISKRCLYHETRCLLNALIHQCLHNL